MTLLLWPEVNGRNYDVIPQHDHEGMVHFGAKLEEMMKNMPKWKQKFMKTMIPKESEFAHDPRIEAVHPDNELSLVAKRAIENYFGEKLEEEPAKGPQKTVKFADPEIAEASPENSDAPAVKPVEPQSEEDEEDNFLWLAVGGVALGAAGVWLWSTKNRQPILNVDGENVGYNAGYAKMPEKRNRPSREISDSESSGADRASRSTPSQTTSDIYSSIRRSLQDTDPGTVWKSVRASFSADAGAGISHDHLPSESVRQQYGHQTGTAETSSVSHTDSEEEITEVYDRVKKSLKNLNLLPRKSQDGATPPGKGGASGSSFR